MSFDFSKIVGMSNGSKGRGNSVLLLDFLKSKRGSTIANHMIQTDAVMYLHKMYNKRVSPDTMSRLWRKLREDYNDDRYNSSLHLHGISVSEVRRNGSIQKHYQIGFSDGRN
tara:strand:- start:242 stop:577 length:336 start_codon:yes stop_codon:yes gene_type:complete